MKLSELESTYCFHESTIEKITYDKSAKKVVLEITFCRWIQDWYDEEKDAEIETLILTFENVSKTDCSNYTAGMYDEILSCELIVDECFGEGVAFSNTAENDFFVITIFADEVLVEHRENKNRNQPR